MAQTAYNFYAISPDGTAVRPFVEHRGGDADKNDCTFDSDILHLVNRELETREGTRRIFGDLVDHYPDHQFEVRRGNDKNWQDREAKRLESVYLQLPEEWRGLELPEGHFAHVAEGGEASDLIAYTESPQKGERDIQTRMRAGKYIKKFFPEMSGSDVRRYAEAVQAAQIKLNLTDDPDLAATIYENGPGSCMRSKDWAWSGVHRGRKWLRHSQEYPRHPVAAYFAGDLQLAWLGRSSRAEARVIVWPAKKLYSRIYGARDRMEIVLHRNGYKPALAGDDRCVFSGARMKIIRYSASQIILPFLDNVAYLEYVPSKKGLFIGARNTLNSRKSELIRGGNTQGLATLNDPDASLFKRLMGFFSF